MSLIKKLEHKVDNMNNENFICDSRYFFVPLQKQFKRILL